LVEISQKGFQSTTLWVGEVGGQAKGAQVGKRLVKGLQAPLQFSGPWGECGLWCWPKSAERIAEEYPAICVVGHPIGLHKKDRI
jgi:hypothetical protein